MLIELVDRLRCPRPHDDTWLVASVTELIDRDIIVGVLGCPLCQAEYPIREGGVIFAETERPTARPASEENALRLAAALELTDRRRVAVLQGMWAADAPLVRAMSPAPLFLLNPPRGMPPVHEASVIVARTAPFAQRSVGAVAIDASADMPMVAQLVRALEAGGRMLGSAEAVPSELSAIIREADFWVAEQRAAVLQSVSIRRKQ